MAWKPQTLINNIKQETIKDWPIEQSVRPYCVYQSHWLHPRRPPVMALTTIVIHPKHVWKSPFRYTTDTNCRCERDGSHNRAIIAQILHMCRPNDIAIVDVLLARRYCFYRSRAEMGHAIWHQVWKCLEIFMKKMSRPHLENVTERFLLQHSIPPTWRRMLQLTEYDETPLLKQSWVGTA